MKKDIVSKVISYETPEKGNVGFYSVGSDPAVSKKASGSSDSNIKSLIEELSPIGFVKITSGISDSAASAIASMQLTLNGRDNEVRSPRIQDFYQ
jgi:hypothetical protein